MRLPMLFSMLAPHIFCSFCDQRTIVSTRFLCVHGPQCLVRSVLCCFSNSTVQQDIASCHQGFTLMLQEAEIEDDVEATRVLDWNKAAADAAYRAKVEEAEARQRALLEQQAAEV